MSASGATATQTPFVPELGSASSGLQFQVPNTGVWTDVPALTVLVPAGVPWAVEVATNPQITLAATGMPAAGTNLYCLLRVVDYATASIYYGYGIYQQPSNGLASSSTGASCSFVQDNDPLTVATVIKLQAFAPNVAGVTTYLYVASGVVEQQVLRAVRR